MEKIPDKIAAFLLISKRGTMGRRILGLSIHKKAMVNASRFFHDKSIPPVFRQLLLSCGGTKYLFTIMLVARFRGNNKAIAMSTIVRIQNK
jgi:hypothetical protein